MSPKLVSLILFVFTAQSALSGIVERVDYPGFQVIPIGTNKYNLRISHTDGSFLDELVEKTAPGLFQVTGRLNPAGFNPGANLIGNYKQAQYPFLGYPYQQPYFPGYPQQFLQFPQYAYAPFGQVGLRSGDELNGIQGLPLQTSSPPFPTTFPSFTPPPGPPPKASRPASSLPTGSVPSFSPPSESSQPDGSDELDSQSDSLATASGRTFTENSPLRSMVKGAQRMGATFRNGLNTVSSLLNPQHESPEYNYYQNDMEPENDEDIPNEPSYNFVE